MKRVVHFLYAIVLGFTLLFVTRASAADESPTAFHFGANGIFTVMLLSDVQDTQYPPAYLLHSIEAVLSNYDVNLVVLLGDQLDGSNPLLHIGDYSKNVEKALHSILSPLEEAGCRFAYVFGEQDYRAPLSVEKQAAIYQRYQNCAVTGVDESGAYYLSIYPYMGETAVLYLFFLDSGPGDDGNCGAVSSEQIAWYRETSMALVEQNRYHRTPAVAFQHAPVAEIHELFYEVPSGTKHALKGDDIYYLPIKSHVLIGEAGELPCQPDENHGLFDAFVEQGNVFLDFCGHDHLNSFIGSVKGIDLGVAPGSSYTSYGKADVRGVRILRFYEDDVMSYDTIHVRYADLVKTDGLFAVRYYMSTTTRLSNAVKTLVVIVLLLITVLLIFRILIRSSREKSQKMPIRTSS